MSASLLHAVPASSGAGAFSSRADDPRHLLGIAGLSRDSLLEILSAARRFRDSWRDGVRESRELAGVEVGLAFFEDSTRTRVSFDLAAQRLGARTVTISEAGSSISKGESLLDTVRTLGAMGVGLIVVRHRSPGVPSFLARHAGVGVINAGDGTHEHPTQALLDLLTLSDAWGGRFEGRRMAIIGDLSHSRVFRSAALGLRTLGARVVASGPATLMPPDLEALGAEFVPTLDAALDGADAVMALRIQRERMEDGLLPSTSAYARTWGLTTERLSRTRPEAVVLHPGPVNRGVEITSEVADGPRSVILRQVENGVAVRCAVLERCARAAALA